MCPQIYGKIKQLSHQVQVLITKLSVPYLTHITVTYFYLPRFTLPNLDLPLLIAVPLASSSYYLKFSNLDSTGFTLIRLDDKTPLVNVFSMLNGVKSLHLYCGNTKRLKLLTVYIATFLGKHHNLRDGGRTTRKSLYLS